MPVPTARLVVAALGVAIAVLVLPGASLAWWVGLNGLLLAAFFGDWFTAVAPDAVRVRRDLPGVVPLDGNAEIRWTVHNPSGRAVIVALSDALPPSLRAQTRRARLRVAARGHAMAATAINPARRGRFDLGEVVVRVTGPLGLAARQDRRAVPGTLRVFPPFRSRKEAELRIDRARILEVGLRSAKGRGGGTEFDQLREYTIDDESRRIDWAATARLRKPIVRTYRAERNQTVLLLLDAGRTMAGRVAWSTEAASAGDEGIPRFEHALDAVMMLTAVATRLGDRAGLVAFADRVAAVVPPGHSADQLTRVTEAMYALEPDLVESDYRGAFVATLARFRRRALLVVLTELNPEAVAETLLPALPLVVRDHVVVVAAVRDPDVDRWARATPEDGSAAYRKAAAVAALDARRRTVARLRGLGAVVVDELPGQLAPRLADAYLKIKATGRL